jgi:TolB protein
MARPTSTPTKPLTPTRPTPTAAATEQSKSPYGFPFVVYTAWDGQELHISAAKLDVDPIKTYVINQDQNMAYMPVWSPDSSKIAYILYDRSSKQSYFKLHDITNSEINLISSQAVNLVGTYCWTADQKYLVWGDHQTDGSEMDVFRMELATGKIMDLTEQSKVWDAFPSCSPVGDQIAFVSDRKGSGKEEDNIWVMDSQGKNLKRLTNTPWWENVFPGWSPDGTEIAFFRYSYSGEGEYGPAGLWAVKSDGSGERLVTEIKNFVGSVLGAPAWSPDGQYIAYSAGRDEATIYIVTASEGEPVWSSELPGENNEISWSASSDYLIFTNTQDEVSRIYMLSIDDLNLAPMLPYADNFLGMFGPGNE